MSQIIYLFLCNSTLLCKCTLAPCCSNTLTTSICPLWDATIRGVHLSCPNIWTWSQIKTLQSCPCGTYIHSGLLLISSIKHTSSCTSTCAPFCSKMFTTSKCPFRDATYSAVTPFCRDNLYIVRNTKPLFSVHLKCTSFRNAMIMNALKCRTLDADQGCACAYRRRGEWSTHVVDVQCWKTLAQQWSSFREIPQTVTPLLCVR